MQLKQQFNQPSPVKIMINIGALMDIPTGFYIKCKDGRSVLLGGLGGITAIVGRGNRYKSTIMHYMMLSAMDRMFSTSETSGSTYDTEINIHEHALQRFISRFDNLKDRDILNDGTWSITDKTIYYANKWYEHLKVFLKQKEDNAKKFEVETPFSSRDKETPLKLVMPTFCEIDSFSEFETENVANIQNDNELGDSGGNTVHMRQGLDKTRFLMEAPGLFGKNNHFLLITAHIGSDIQIAQGPYAAPVPKKLQYMKQGDKIKGVTDKFFFLMNNCWHAVNSTPLINQGTKGPEYPRDPNDNASGDTDLNIVALTQLRSKSGPSGYTLDIVVSQSEGVLPSLTEFHFLKNQERFGISGSLQHYNLDLLPDVKLSRTTVRGKIDTDPILRRALNITAELCQMHQYYRSIKDILCTPKQLYDDIAALGYDWNEILSNTRGYWVFNDDQHPVRFVSTMDLLNMRAGTYQPTFLTKK